MPGHQGPSDLRELPERLGCEHTLEQRPVQHREIEKQVLRKVFFAIQELQLESLLARRGQPNDERRQPVPRPAAEKLPKSELPEGQDQENDRLRLHLSNALPKQLEPGAGSNGRRSDLLLPGPFSDPSDVPSSSERQRRVWLRSRFA